MKTRFLFAPEGEAAPSGAQPGAAAVVPPPAVVTPPATAASAAATPEADPNWLKPRLEREAAKGRTALMKELGVKDEAELKSALAASRAASEAAKTTEQKRIEAEQRAQQLEQELTELRGGYQSLASTRMAALTEQQREAITALAGDDPHAQVLAIDALTPTWAAAAPPPAATPRPAPPAPPAGGTAPPPNAPPQQGNVSPPDHKAIYENLKRTNPHAAALYVNKYADAIYAPRS